jgi:hypothetical protein
MRKPFEAKFMHMHEGVDDAREAIRRIGDAAESQARLNIALTGVCCLALIAAILLVRSERTGG